MTKRVALYGAIGFVGSAIHEALKARGLEVTPVTLETYEQAIKGEYDYAVNAAMPSARFKAKTDPEWDFRETVEKTAQLFYRGHFGKFIQISSVSARCQPDTVYGRHKAAAEAIVNHGNHLVVRLGPMFGPTLTKGVLIDMLNGSRVYLSGKSRYAFAPLSFVTGWIADNLDRSGVVEVGARNSIGLQELSERLGLKSEFEGAEDNQEMQTVDPSYPDVELVLDYMRQRKEGIK